MIEISDVNVKLVGGKAGKVRALCGIVIDNAFVVHDFQVIEDANGMFVGMPSLPVSARCHKCHAKNFVKAFFCATCGARMMYKLDNSIHMKTYEDIAYPINDQCRELIQKKVLEAYQLKLKDVK
ncbi:MAG: septation protein SpoVG family protein [Planctomycetes bacterium]|nr:septation protein SpoVG family protein [Planctomycetota bacterium]